MNRPLFFTICALAAPIGLKGASDADLLKNIDFNKDGKLNEVEIKAGIKHRLSPDKVDLAQLRKKGKVTSEDVGEVEDAVALAFWEFQRDFGPKSSYAINGVHNGKRITADYFAFTRLEDDRIDATSYWVLQKKTFQEGLKVRRSAEQLTLPPDNAAGATFSYTDDLNKKTDQWAAHGVVAYDWTWETNEKFGYQEGAKSWVGQELAKDYFYLRPSIAFDKVSSSGDPKSEIDSLVFRLGVGRFLTLAPGKGNALIGSVVAEVNAVYETDFGNEHGVFGGELNVTPFSRRFGLNSTPTSFGPLLLNKYVILHVEGGAVTDDGEIPALANQNSYFRAGGIAGITLVPKKWTDLVMGASYKYYVALTDETFDIELFNAYAEARLFGSQHISLKVDYNHGRMTNVAQREHLLTIGLGVVY